MKRVAGLLMLYFLSATDVVANDCVCPKIPASGQGNTSCSASEASNRCTVDYNEFYERERRSVEFLSKANIGPIRAPDPSMNAAEALARLRGRNDELADAVLIYLMVALSAQPSASDLVPAARAIAEVVRSQTISSRVAEAFSSREAGGDDSLLRSPPQNVRVEQFSVGDRVSGRIVPGCVEFYARDAWVMFKAQWSPYRFQPRCGQ
jgi:hypothetical protein